jgi:hypothetical protein
MPRCFPCSALAVLRERGTLRLRLVHAVAEIDGVVTGEGTMCPLAPGARR